MYKAYTSTLVLVLLALVTARAQSTDLGRLGGLSRADSSTTFLIQVSGDCAPLAVTAVFNALRRNGYKVVLDGERRRQFGAQQVSVIVGDSIIRRREPTVELYRLFETPPADYIVLMYGDLNRLNVRRPLLHFVNRANGQLELILDGSGLIAPMRWSTFSKQVETQLASMREKDDVKNDG